MKGFFLLLSMFTMFSAYIVHSEFTGSIDIGQRQQNPVMTSVADGSNETGTMAGENRNLDSTPLIISAIVILLIIIPIYLARRHIINVVP